MSDITRFVRYLRAGQVAYGMLHDEIVAELNGNFLANATPTGRSVALADVLLLAPVEPSKVIAVGLNYRSHIGARVSPEYPGIFAKMPTSIIGPGKRSGFRPGRWTCTMRANSSW